MRIKTLPRILLMFLLMFFLLAGTSLAVRETCYSSDQQSASAAIKASAGYFYGIAVITDATNAVTVDIYDNASAASGTKLIPTWVITTSSTDRCQSYDAPAPIRVRNGIYVNITCDGTVKYIVYYE